MSDKVKVEVFFSQTCPHCPAQKELAKQFESDDVKVSLTDVARNQKRAKNFGVRSVPTTVINGPEIDEIMGFRGVMKEEKLEDAIKLAKGDISMEDFKPDSVMDKIKGIFSG